MFAVEKQLALHILSVLSVAVDI